MDSKRVIRETRLASIILILLVAFGVLLIISQFLFYDNKPENFGVIGDAVSGILSPIIAIAGVLLTFLAFYIQKLANDEIKQQFLQQQNDNHENFLFSSYKERGLLIISEINNFSISFHDGTLISDTDLLNNPGAKKYNFVGIQAINLFYIEFYKLMGEDFENFKLSDSFHSISLHLNNLITAFYNLHLAVEKCNLKSEYCEELQELLHYIYYSKLNYFIGYLKDKPLPAKSKEQVDYLYSQYDNSPKKE